MYKLIQEAVMLLLTAIYINCRGTSVTTTVQTGEVFSYTCPTDNGMLKLTSEEYKHKTTFKHWYLPNQVRYTYLVQMEQTVGELKEVIEVLPMPMLCSRRFAGTTLPHRLAVADCLNRFFPQK